MVACRSSSGARLSSRRGRIDSGPLLAIASLVALAALSAVLLIDSDDVARRGREPLILYCAAGLKVPIDAIAREYEAEYGARVQIQYGGSGTLLANLEVARRGDLFLAADESYLQIARDKGLVRETLSLARMTPVIVVPDGNPAGIESIASLIEKRVPTSLAEPDAAAIGKVARETLRASGQWDALVAIAKVFKPTVNDVANDVKLGAAGAGIVWDATVAQYPELDAVAAPEIAAGARDVRIGVLESCRQPAAALHFARFLAARDRGLPIFARHGFTPVEGDDWADVPELVLYSGGVNRVAIEETLREFEKREGVSIVTKYNGCGILVGDMKSGGRPDAYFACDAPFLDPVADLFTDAVTISETAVVIAVPRGNPRGLARLDDVAAPGLRLGVASPQKSALGALTERLLRAAGIFDAVRANVRAETPTADLLVNMIRTGSLDAVIVYAANVANVREHLDAIAVELPGARATQPFSIGAASRHRRLASRLSDALRSAGSRARFESAGFRWLDGEPPSARDGKDP